MKTVLVTGAAGFVGRHVIPMLASEEYEVHALYYPAPIDFEENRAVRWHYCDLMNGEDIHALVRDTRPTHLLHLAWYTEHGKYWNSELNLDWVSASINLFKVFVEEGGGRIVTAGTCAEYDWDYGYLSETTTPLRPQTLYGTCKSSLYGILAKYAEINGISAAWGRVFFPYGPFEQKKRLVPDVIISLLKDNPALCTEGNQIRDYLHVEDVASAFVRLLGSDVGGPVNIASGEPVAIKTVVSTIAELLGKQDLVRLGALPAREGDAPFIVGDVRRLAGEVNWRPRHSLESGLESAVVWWRDNAVG